MNLLTEKEFDIVNYKNGGLVYGETLKNEENEFGRLNVRKIERSRLSVAIISLIEKKCS